MGRRLERIELVKSIGVEDVINGGALGELVNITVEGIMVMSNRALSVGSIFQLRLHTPEESGLGPIDVGVDCLWVQQAGTGTDKYFSGFQIIDASPEAIATIEKLINDYGIQNE